MNALRNNPDLGRADLEYLMYLDAFLWFTRKQIQEGKLACRWDIKRDQRLIREGWIKKTNYVPNTRLGEHNKYTITGKASRLINKMYKQLKGEEKISESPYSNAMFKNIKKIDKHYQEAIRLFNRDRER